MLDKNFQILSPLDQAYLTGYGLAMNEKVYFLTFSASVEGSKIYFFLYSHRSPKFLLAQSHVEEKLHFLGSLSTSVAM